MDAFSFAGALRRLLERCPAAAQAPGVQQLAEEQVRGCWETRSQCMQASGCTAAAAAAAACRRRRLPPLPPPPARGACGASTLCRPTPGALPAQAPDPTRALQALQQLLVLRDCTLPAATLFRPVLLKAVAGLVEAALGSQASVQPSPDLAVALLSVLELAPHTEGCAGGPAWSAATPASRPGRGAAANASRAAPRPDLSHLACCTC